MTTENNSIFEPDGRAIPYVDEMSEGDGPVLVLIPGRGLEGGALYDPLTNYNRVKGKWSDWDIDPAYKPTGTSTRDTPPQDSSQKRPLDPQLNAPVDTAPDRPANETK